METKAQRGSTHLLRPHSELVGRASLLTSERPRMTRVQGPASRLGH